MPLRAIICLVLAALIALAPGAATAQSPPQSPPQSPTEPAAQEAPAPLPDYAAWAGFAAGAEAAIEDSAAPDPALEALRAELAGWRERFVAAQHVNRARIETIRAQIAALGPAPADGEAEAGEIAARRAELNEQLARLQAPGLAADEAYRRADGLIREIDATLRDRQADALLRLWPAPVNPAHWPAGARALREAGAALWDEAAAAWASQAARQELRDNLPLVLVCLALGLVLLARGRRTTRLLTLGLHERTAPRWREVVALAVSFTLIVVPTFGAILLARGIGATGMAGPNIGGLAAKLPFIAFAVFTAVWLGGRVFPRRSGPNLPLRLPAEARAQGRLLALAFGLLLGVELLLRGLLPEGLPEAARAVIAFPPLVLAGVLLVRIGQLLRRHPGGEAEGAEPPSYRSRLVGILGRAAVAVGVAGPVLAAVGYVPAAAAAVYPAALSLALVGLLLVVQKAIGDSYVLVTGAGEQARDALAPVLAGFVLTLAMLPVFALIWGARVADLSEIWTRFRDGFTLGETRISPTDFLMFAVVFGIGYGFTRLVQGALRASVLPRTKLDQGGQNAIVAGAGYAGVFLAALIAINTTGLDLSSLAIVAGALSVGIGFGLQNIVSNFVSGVILLIERPVSEGDWIEVGGVQGRVRAISVRSTRIETFDRSDVIVPNTDLIAGRVTNWTRFSLTGRLIVPVVVAYGSDSRRVAEILQEIAVAQPLAVLNPPPSVVFAGMNERGLMFEIRAILRDVNFLSPVRSEINHRIVQRLAEEGIDLARPAPVPPLPAPKGAP